MSAQRVSFLAVGVLFGLGTVLSAAPPSAVGTWQGALKAGAIELRLIIYLTQTETGYSAKFDSVDQGAQNIPFSSATVEGKTVTLVAKAAGATYTATLAEDGNTLKGEWKQSGQTFPLELKRDDKVAELKRPQTPKPPFPYRAEEVTFASQAADVKLAGTLTLPTGAGPFPAAILISGSGPQDRDETILQHKPFAVLADHLTRNGVAVLRYDDRGVGKSTGKFAGALTTDFAEDTRGAVAFLASRKDIDAKRIGLIGHSEGGLIAPLVAAKSETVAFIVLLAGPGLPGHEVLSTQMQAVAKAAGETASASNTKAQRRLLDLAISDISDAELRKAITATIQEEFAKLTAEEKKQAGPDAAKQAEEQSQAFAAPWMRWFLRHDPRPVLQQVRCPVLALNGATDVQVDATANLAAIDKAVRAGGNKRVTTQSLPGLNHLFQSSKTGAVSEYSKIDETFAPSALDVISAWLRDVIRP